MSANERVLDIGRLRRMVNYDPLTGEFTRRNGGRVIRTGSLDSKGYVVICVGYHLYRAHRLAWFYHHGTWPEGDIDHVNGIRTDNRISNLRDICRSRNLLNRHAPRPENRLGIVGVRKRNSKYEARLQFRGKRLQLGVFDTPEEASSVVETMRARLIEGGSP